MQNARVIELGSSGVKVTRNSASFDEAFGGYSNKRKKKFSNADGTTPTASLTQLLGTLTLEPTTRLTTNNPLMPLYEGFYKVVNDVNGLQDNGSPKMFLKDTIVKGYLQTFPNPTTGGKSGYFVIESEVPTTIGNVSTTTIAPSVITSVSTLAPSLPSGGTTTGTLASGGTVTSVGASSGTPTSTGTQSSPSPTKTIPEKQLKSSATGMVMKKFKLPLNALVPAVNTGVGIPTGGESGAQPKTYKLKEDFFTPNGVKLFSKDNIVYGSIYPTQNGNSGLNAFPAIGLSYVGFGNSDGSVFLPSSILEEVASTNTNQGGGNADPNQGGGGTYTGGGSSSNDALDQLNALIESQYGSQTNQGGSENTGGGSSTDALTQLNAQIEAEQMAQYQQEGGAQQQQTEGMGNPYNGINTYTPSEEELMVDVDTNYAPDTDVESSFDGFSKSNAMETKINDLATKIAWNKEMAEMLKMKKGVDKTALKEEYMNKVDRVNELLRELKACETPANREYILKMIAECDMMRPSMKNKMKKNIVIQNANPKIIDLGNATPSEFKNDLGNTIMEDEDSSFMGDVINYSDFSGSSTTTALMGVGIGAVLGIIGIVVIKKMGK